MKKIKKITTTVTAVFLIASCSDTNQYDPAGQNEFQKPNDEASQMSETLDKVGETEELGYDSQGSDINDPEFVENKIETDQFDEAVEYDDDNLEYEDSNDISVVEDDQSEAYENDFVGTVSKEESVNELSATESATVESQKPNNESLSDEEVVTTTDTQEEEKVSMPGESNLNDKMMSADRETIVKVQKMLEIIGYKPGIADGVLGPNTSNALTKFQKEKGLEATGSLDGQTLRALNIGPITETIYSE